MFIYNLKVNGSKLFIAIFAIMIILLILVVGMVVFKIFNGAASSDVTSSCMPQGNINKIEAKNYTNILKAVHDNIDNMT